MFGNKKISRVLVGFLLGVLVALVAPALYREFAPPSEPRLSYTEFVMKVQKGEVWRDISLKGDVAYFFDLTDNTKKWAYFPSPPASLPSFTSSEWLQKNGYIVEILRPFERRFE